MQTTQERTLIVGIELTSRGRTQAGSIEPVVDVEESLEELAILAESAGGVVLGRMLQQRATLDAATLVGSGKVAEIKQRVIGDELDAVIFDRELSPTQLRNLEHALGCKVIDRTQLILDIFARRARTKRGSYK